MTTRIFAAWQKHPGRGVLLLLLLAFLLRGWDLGGKSLWLDEAYAVIQGQKAELATPLVRVDSHHPSLYFTLLHYWMPLAGQSEAAIRLPSALASVLSVALLYRLGRHLFDRKVGTMAAALLAVSPLDLWYAQEARMYIFVTLAGLLIAVGLARERWWGAVLIFLGLGAGLYVDYLMLPLWVGISAVWLVYWWQRGHRAIPFLAWLVGSAAGWVLYRPWWDTFRQVLDNAVGNVFIFARLRDLVGLPELNLADFLLALGLVGIALVVGSSLLQRLLGRDRPRLVLTALIVSGFVGLTASVPIPRAYSIKRVLVTGWPFVILLVAWLVMQLETRRDLVRGGLLGLSLVLSIVTLTVPKDDWRGALTYVAENAEEGEEAVIWLDPRWNWYQYEYYRPGVPHERGEIEHLETVASRTDDIWLIAERYPGNPIPASPSERWLDEHWQLVEAIPFYRLEVRHYRPN